MKLKELFRKLDLTIPKNLTELPKEIKKQIENTAIGRSLLQKAQEANCPVEEFLSHCEVSELLSPRAQVSVLVIDSGTTGFAAILDGRERFSWFYVLLATGRLSPELDLPVVQLNCSSEDGDDTESNFIHPGKIRRFLKDNWQLRDLPRDEVISHYVRRIVRHLSSLPASGRHASESAMLALELSRYLPQVKIAQVLGRSEAWVSAACSLGNLEQEYLTALQQGKISYSACLILAETESTEERSLLYELATNNGAFSIRTLRVALQFLKLNQGFARKSDAMQKIMKLIAERTVKIRNHYSARLRLIFRNRRPLWQVRFVHKRNLRSDQKEEIQTGPATDYRSLLHKLLAAERALATFPL